MMAQITQIYKQFKLGLDKWLDNSFYILHLIEIL